MSFQPNIPLPSDLISVSQGDLRNNFTVLNTAWNVNHVAFNSLNSGKHNFVEMPNQGSDPAGALTEMTLFSKLASGVSQVFYKRDAAATSYQLTGDDPVASATGSSSLPGGIIIKWGKVTTASNGTATVNWAFPNNIFSAQLTRVKSLSSNNRNSLYWSSTPAAASGSMLLVDSGGSGFSDTVFYVAIGN